MKPKVLFILLSFFVSQMAVSGFFPSDGWGISIRRADRSTTIPETVRQSQERFPTAMYTTYLPIVRLENVTVYYVSSQGNDANPGTFQRPWKTLKKAAGSVTPGTIVYIRAGTYHEFVIVSRSGTQAQPIKFLAYPGENPVLDGQNNLPTSEDGLLTIKGDWVEVNGLEVTNSNYIGIGLYGKHDTLTNVFIHHSWRNGIYINGDYGTVQASRVWRNSMHSENGVENGSSGIAASRDESDGITEYAVIRQNVVWENWGQGINIHQSNYVNVEGNTSYDNYTANIYIHDTTNVICQRNFFYMNPNNTYMGNSGSKVGILMGEEYSPPIAENIQVINNVVYGNHRNLFWYTGDKGGGMKNVLFANNTFVNGSGSSPGNCNVILDPAVNVNVRFENNIVEQDDGLPVIGTVVQAGVTYSHNLWSKKPVSAASDATGDVVGDPKLAKVGQPYAVAWFTLTSTSPAIHAALPLPEVGIDYFGTARGSSPDMGAIQYTP